jgi:hypothetical protein
VILGLTIVSWVVLAFAAPWHTLADGRSTAVGITLMAWGWAGWTAVAIALLVPAPMSLTALRTITPLAIVCSIVAASPLAVFMSVLAMVLASASVLADYLVQGGAYGDEQRFALRTPVPYMAPAVIAWAAFAAALIGGTILIAAQNYVVGVPLTLLGVFLARTVPARLHRLSRRWLVLVPAGVVLHDHLVLGETVMVQKRNITRIAVVPEAGESADLTGGIAGQRIAVEIRESEKVVLSPITAKTLGTSIALHVNGFSFAPRRLNDALAALTQ